MYWIFTLSTLEMVYKVCVIPIKILAIIFVLVVRGKIDALLALHRALWSAACLSHLIRSKLVVHHTSDKIFAGICVFALDSACINRITGLLN